VQFIVWHVFSVDQAMTSQKPQYYDCSFVLTLFFKRAMSIEPSNMRRSGVEGQTLKKTLTGSTHAAANRRGREIKILITRAFHFHGCWST
jgi:hypothetical protein